VKVKEIAVEKAKLELQKSRAAYNLGLVSKISTGNGSFAGLEQAESALVQAQSDLESIQNELAQTFVKLNQLIGLNPEKRAELVDELEFYPVEVASVDVAVSHALEQSPSIWQAQQG